MSSVSLPERRDSIQGNTDTSLLKTLALIFMLIDHIGARVITGVPELRIIGRMAFPLYAWCLVVGSVKTSNPWKYAFRLLVMAVVSQPLYMMALQHKITDLNILFTLFLALMAIVGIQKQFCFSQFWAPALCYAALAFLNVDYGWKGITFILLLYAVRNTRMGLIAAYMAFALFWGSSSSSVNTLFGMQLTFLKWPGVDGLLKALFRLQGMVWLSLPLIAIPMHSDFRMPKWLGYALYPMHLVLLIILRMLINGTSLATLLAVF